MPARPLNPSCLKNPTHVGDQFRRQIFMWSGTSTYFGPPSRVGQRRLDIFWLWIWVCSKDLLLRLARARAKTRDRPNRHAHASNIRAPAHDLEMMKLSGPGVHADRLAPS